MSEPLRFKKFNHELDDLILFMTTNTWEFHSNPNPTKEQIVNTYKNGWYENDRETFWIEYKNQKIGMLIIHDFSDTIPSFDIRIDGHYQGKGFGEKAVTWLIDYIFQLPDEKIRLEAYTRNDNIRMRKTLHKCGFVKEGYLRQSWENDDGSIHDSVCYSVIRTDWENNVKTPTKLYDLPF